MKKYKITKETLNEINNKYDSKLVNGTMLPTWAGVIAWVYEHGGGEGGLSLNSLIAGDNMEIVKNIINNTATFNAIGGGSAEQVYVIKGTATITDPSSLVDIPITITTPNYYNDLKSFYDTNGRLPRIIADVTLMLGTETLSNVQLDMFANNIDLDNDEIEFEGALVEETKSVSYIEFNLTPTNQEGALSSIQLQERLTSDSEIQAKIIRVANRIWFDNYYIDKPSLSALLDNVNRLVEKELPTFVNDKYLKVVNGELSWEDAGGSGGSKYYLHTISFNTTDDLHLQVGVITKSSSTYSNLSAFWNDITRIVTIFGTPNPTSTEKKIYFNGAMSENSIIHLRGVDNEFDVVTRDIARYDVDEASFGDYGVEEL